MTIRARLYRWKLQGYAALITLAALVLPTISEAACLQADLSPRIAYSLNVAALVVRDVQQPAETPASVPGQATNCQHGHCGHTQVAPDADADMAAAFPLAGLRPRPIYPQMADDDLMAGPDRPPQA
jgi:hypothetical protein